MHSFNDDHVSIGVAELQALRARLADAEDKLDALYRGAVDALVVKGPHGPKVYSLQDADHPYRVLIEQMHEAALTLNSAFAAPTKRRSDCSEKRFSACPLTRCGKASSISTAPQRTAITCEASPYNTLALRDNCSIYW